MAVSVFDTLAYSKTLQTSGIAQEYADAFVEALNNAMNEMIETKELATKADLEKINTKFLNG